MCRRVSVPPPTQMSDSYHIISSTSDRMAILLGLILLLALYLGNRPKIRNNLPPGPPKLPFIGNLLQVSALRPHPQFFFWAQKYGPIFHLQFGPQNAIVLNSAEAADELLNNRSQIYSGRVAPHMAQDIVSAGQRLLFLPYKREWKTIRKTLKSFLGPGPSKLVQPSQDRESRVLLYDLLMHDNGSLTERCFTGSNGEVPEGHWFRLIRRYANSVALNLVYGRRVNRIVDARVDELYAVVANFVRAAQPGNYLADTFPILRKLPDFLAPWRLEGLRMHNREMALFGGYLKEVRDKVKNGIETNCLVGTYLQQRAEGGCEDAPGYGLTENGWLKDTMLTYTAGSVLEAGSETTASTIQIFILFMLHHPDALKAAREEIDAVVGTDRMPNWDDEPQLPYLIACIKETMRLRPTLVLGVPHSNDEDDIYNGYLIPKGSVIIANVWAIHRDPVRYPNPTLFNPGRFVKKGKPSSWGGGPDAQDRDHYALGWGRRFCQGSHIAEASLFIVLSRILWGIDLCAPTGPETGKPVLPDLSDEEGTFTDGFAIGPRAFGVGFKARSEKHELIIRKAFEDVQSEWNDLGLAVDER